MHAVKNIRNLQALQKSLYARSEEYSQSTNFASHCMRALKNIRKRSFLYDIQGSMGLLKTISSVVFFFLRLWS